MFIYNINSSAYCARLIVFVRLQNATKVTAKNCASQAMHRVEKSMMSMQQGGQNGLGVRVGSTGLEITERRRKLGANIPR